MAKTKIKMSVGLVVVTHDLNGNLVAVLQRRGPYNHEKAWVRENYPGGCQVTVHGGVGEDETVDRALFRETVEELGPTFAHKCLNCGHPLGGLTQVFNDGEVLTFARYVDRGELSHIRWGPSSGGIEFVSAEDIPDISDLGFYDKNLGVIHLNNIAMFPDEIRAVKIALDCFKDIHIP